MADPWEEYADQPAAAEAPKAAPAPWEEYGEAAPKPAGGSVKDYREALAAAPWYKRWAAEASAGVTKNVPFASDIGAAARSVVHGTPFAEEKQRIQNYRQAATEENPYLTGGAQLGSAFLMPIPGAGSAGMLRSAATAGGLGALYGAEDGSTLGERAKNAALGAVGGTALGAATPWLAKGVGEAGQWATTKARQYGIGNSEKLADAELSAARARAAQAGAARTGSGGLTPQEALEGLRAGQPILPIDIGGDVIQRTAKAAKTRSDEAQALLKTALNERKQNQYPRISEFLHDVATRDVNGNPGAYPRVPLNDSDQIERLTTAARQMNQPAYDAASQYAQAQGGMWSPQLEKLINHSQIQKYVPQAIRELNDAGVTGRPSLMPAASPFRRDAATGNYTLDVGTHGAPPLEFWQTLKQNLGGALADARHPMRGNANDARQLGSAYEALRDELHGMNDLYRQADQGAHEWFGARNAYDAGVNYLSLSQTRNQSQAAQRIQAMNPAERELFARGFLTDLDRRLAAQRDQRNLGAIFTSPAFRTKIRLALGDARGDQVYNYLNRENKMNNPLTGLGGSDTHSNQLDWLRSISHHGAGAFLGAGLGGYDAIKEHGLDPAALAKGVIGGGAAGWAGQKALHLGDRQAIAVANRLLDTDPAAVRAAAADLYRPHPPAGPPAAIHRGLMTLAGEGGESLGKKLGDIWGAVGRASGGRVGEIAQKQADKACKRLGESFNPLLNSPDEHIADALRVARESSHIGGQR